MSETPGVGPLYRLARLDICVLQTEVWELVNDLEVLDGLMRQLSETDPRRWQLLRAAEHCLDRVDLTDVGTTAGAARAELIEVLDRPAHASAHRISAVGHATSTRRGCGRCGRRCARWRAPPPTWSS